MVRPANAHVTAWVRREVEAKGVRPTGRKLQFSDSTIAKLASGLPVSEGIAVLAEQRISHLEKEAA